MMHSLRFTVTATCLLASIAACRTAHDPDDEVAGMEQSSMTDILAVDIEKAQLQQTTALDVIQKLRPAFLVNSIGAGKRTGLAVTVNGGPMDDVGALSRVAATGIESIRYYTATQAGLRFGFRANGPVILVTLKPHHAP